MRLQGTQNHRFVLERIQAACAVAERAAVSEGAKTLKGESQVKPDRTVTVTERGSTPQRRKYRESE